MVLSVFKGVSYFHTCFHRRWSLVAMAADGNLGSIRYSFLHKYCAHIHNEASVLTHTHIYHLVKHFTYVPIYRCSGVCRYLANRVKWAALSMSIADTHPTHRDVFDGIIILRNTVTQKVSESTSQFIGQRSTFCSLSHPPSDNRVNISRIASTQGHQVGIQCSDSLKSQSDVTRRRKIQQI